MLHRLELPALRYYFIIVLITAVWVILHKLFHQLLKTTEFNPQIDEIIEEAYERTGVLGTRTGYQLRSARRSLNLLFQEWGNRGVHLWKVKLAKVPLVEGQAEYSFASDSTNFPQDIDTVLEAYYRNNSDATAPSRYCTYKNR